MSNKLKPCPICGSEVNMIKENIGEYTVVCHGCQVLMIADDVSSKNEAIERWNNRVNEQKWIPIEEQEPIYEGWYIVYFPLNEETGDVDYIDLCLWNGICFEGGALGHHDERDIYTHWMALPEPPKGE